MADFTGGCCETFDMGDHGFQATNIKPGQDRPRDCAHISTILEYSLS